MTTADNMRGLAWRSVFSGWLFGPRRQVGVTGFILGYSLATLVLFHGPFFARAVSFLDAFDAFGWLTLASVLVILIFLKVVALSLLSFVSLWALKWVCIVLMLINAFAFYFIVTYGALIDSIIIRNVFATNTKTTMDLMHPLLGVFVLVFGVLPAWVIARLQIVGGRWRLRLGLLAVVVAGSVSWVWATSWNWLWIDRHIPVLGSLTLPWNYLVNTVTFLRAEAALQREQELLPPLAFTLDPPEGQRLVVVLVLGEAARRQNHAQYEYTRATNPFTADLDIAALPQARSCTTYTLGSLACMLTHEGSAAPVGTRWEPLPGYLHRHGVDVDWRTNSSGEPRVTANSYTTLAELRASCTGDGCDRLEHEEGLLHGLRARIDASQAERMLVVLHQGNGSHGPAYHTQYPPEFEHFSPVCATVQIQNCSSEELVNAYDNTIVYTDYILRRTIDMLATLEDTAAVMIYISDHGQALGEGGVYLHGLPNSIAPDVMRDIPFLVWMDDDFRAWRGLSTADLERAPAHTMDHVFNSVLGAMGAQSPVYRPEFDIFRTPG